VIFQDRLRAAAMGRMPKCRAVSKTEGFARKYSWGAERRDARERQSLGVCRGFILKSLWLSSINSGVIFQDRLRAA